MCQWKFFTKPYFCINPVGKSKVPSWKIFISLLENYFFSVGKSNFRSRAILGDFFGSLLNYFKRFLFILTPCAVRQLKVKMFDSERWVMSLELWVFSTKEQKDMFSLLNLMFLCQISLLTTHHSLLKNLSYCVIGVPLSTFVKKQEKGILDRVKKIQNHQPSYSQANTKPWKNLSYTDIGRHI